MLWRNIHHRIEEALADTPVVLLQGARQTGKTTIVRAIAEEGSTRRKYLTLDDAAVLAAARMDPTGFIAGLSGPVVLDEIQLVPELFAAIKVAVDRERQPGRFLLTGSANVLLLPRLSESLAGRMEILHLWPLSQGEIAGHVEGFVDRLFDSGGIRWSLELIEDAGPVLWERILTGGYPEARTRVTARRRQAWFGSYVTTILQRDVRELANIDGLASLPRILELIAGRAGSLLNVSELSRSLGIPQTSLKRYLALLEATFLVRWLPPWSTNLARDSSSPRRPIWSTRVSSVPWSMPPMR